MTKIGNEKENNRREGDMNNTFSIWFKSFSTLMLTKHGVYVTLRDGNAIMYRILYDRGHAPEKAALMFHFRQ
ncbi:MAG: hypothetical protein OEV92_04185 [Nitrospinota bacterium]|nr:hypothetical protein [Nitrospinota bacterium]